MSRTMRTSVISMVFGMGLLAGALVLGPFVVEQFAYAMQKGKTTAIREQLPEMAKADRLSPLFSAVAEAVQPAVVVVQTTQRVNRPVGRTPMPFDDDMLRRFFGDEFEEFRRRQREREERGESQPYYRRGQGSGVIVDARRGYILTNNHVVQGADRVDVVLSDGRRFTTDWVRRDPRTDLAVIKIEADNLIEAPLGDSEAIRVGHWVLALGAPFGFDQSVTAGIVSSKGRVALRGSNMYQNYIQTDAAINRGNSGGPLVNTRGEVVGINTMIFSSTGVSAGVGLAVPSNMARTVMAQLIEKGRVDRGFLGVGIQDLSPELAESFDLPSDDGALITRILPGGAAARAGLQERDVIVAVDGKPVDSVNKLRLTVASIPPGRAVPVTVFRNGKKQTIRVTMGRLDAEQARVDTPDAPDKGPAIEQPVEKFGLKVVTLTPALREAHEFEAEVAGVFVENVSPDSPASGTVPQGWAITHVNDKPVTTAEQFAQAVSQLKPGQGVRLRLVSPSDVVQFVFIKPGS